MEESNSKFSELMEKYNVERDSASGLFKQATTIYTSSRTRTVMAVVEGKLKVLQVTPLFLSNTKKEMEEIFKPIILFVTGVDIGGEFAIDDNTVIDEPTLFSFIYNQEVHVLQTCPMMETPSQENSLINIVSVATDLFVVPITPVVYDQEENEMTVMDIISDYDDEILLKVLPFIKMGMRVDCIDLLCSYIEDGVDMTPNVKGDESYNDLLDYYELLQQVCNQYSNCNLQVLKSRDIKDILIEWRSKSMDQFVNDNGI